MSQKLILQPDLSESMSASDKAKILDDSEVVAKYLSDEKENIDTLLATNGEDLAIRINSKLYFFDLKTGKRYVDV